MRPAMSSGRMSSCSASAMVMAIDDEAGSGEDSDSPLADAADAEAVKDGAGG